MNTRATTPEERVGDEVLRQTMIIQELKQTCIGYPSQWEFRTGTERPAYVRYRWGHLTVQIGRQGQESVDLLDCVYAVDEKVGCDFDGEIEWPEVEKRLAGMDEGKIVELFKTRDEHVNRLNTDAKYRKRKIREVCEGARSALLKQRDKFQKQTKKILKDRTLSKKIGKKLNRKLKRILRKSLRKEKAGKRRDRQ